MPSTNSPSLEDRVIELEVRLAHQEQICDDLNDVLVRQSRDVERLKRELTEMRDRMVNTADRDPSPQDNKPPPHY